tara:strand:+ start:3925 stop:4251 length:327 start_codon:yes stop_codon:yes gene_type:complete
MINLETSSLLNNLSHSGGPDIAIAKDMSFLCGWEIKGLDTEGISDDQIENRLADIGSAMQGLYDGEALWLTLERRQTQVPSAQKTTNPLVSIAHEHGRKIYVQTFARL